jgi:hypothetical protein
LANLSANALDSGRDVFYFRHLLQPARETLGAAEAGVKNPSLPSGQAYLLCTANQKSFLACARDRVPHVTRDRQIITGFQLHGSTCLEIQSGMTAKHNHPFVLRLIVPEIWRATVGVRHDALDVRRAGLKKPKKIFRTNLLRQIGKNIFYLDEHNQPFTSRARLIAGTSMMRR